MLRRESAEQMPHFTQTVRRQHRAIRRVAGKRGILYLGGAGRGWRARRGRDLGCTLRRLRRGSVGIGEEWENCFVYCCAILRDRCDLGKRGMLSRAVIVFMEAMTNGGGMDDAGGAGTCFCHGESRYGECMLLSGLSLSLLFPTSCTATVYSC